MFSHKLSENTELRLLEELTDNRTTAVGYWLGEEFQGQGLVTAACRALVDIPFRDPSGTTGRV